MSRPHRDVAAGSLIPQRRAFRGNRWVSSSLGLPSALCPSRLEGPRNAGGVATLLCPRDLRGWQSREMRGRLLRARWGGGCHTILDNFSSTILVGIWAGRGPRVVFAALGRALFLTGEQKVGEVSAQRPPSQGGTDTSWVALGPEPLTRWGHVGRSPGRAGCGPKAAEVRPRR